MSKFLFFVVIWMIYFGMLFGDLIPLWANGLLLIAATWNFFRVLRDGRL